MKYDTEHHYSRRKKYQVIRNQKIIYEHKKSSSGKRIYGLAVIAFILCIAVYFIFSLQVGSTSIKQESAYTMKQTQTYSSLVASASAIEKAVLSLSPTVMPSPTSTPIPTSVVTLGEGSTPNRAVPNGTGYCLYVPVLYYHHLEPMALAREEGHGALTVDSGWFDKQMEYMISHGYTSISLQQLVSAIQQHTPLPAKSFAVSIDDGYSDIYTYAFPILQKYNVKADLFIPTGLMNNPGYMNWDQLKLMQSSGLVNIQNHTWSHAALGGASVDKINFEINTSQQEFKDYLGRTPTIFAYPYGSFNNRVIQILQQDGFQVAYSTLPGQDECSSNLMVAPRTRIGNAPMATYGF